MSLAEDIHGEGPRFDSVDAFLDWAEAQPGKWELWDGVARPKFGPAEMMAGATRNHARIAGNALTALAVRLGAGPCQAYGSDFAVRLGPGRTALPDVSVSCEPEPDGGDKGTDSPVVVVEVLSMPSGPSSAFIEPPGLDDPACGRTGSEASTASYDLGDKASAYRRLPSIRHLVLVRQDRVGVQHFHRDAGGDDFTLTEIDRPDGRLRLAAIGVEVAVAELYARVAFAG